MEREVGTGKDRKKEGGRNEDDKGRHGGAQKAEKKMEKRKKRKKREERIGGQVKR